MIRSRVLKLGSSAMFVALAAAVALTACSGGDKKQVLQPTLDSGVDAAPSALRDDQLCPTIEASYRAKMTEPSPRPIPESVVAKMVAVFHDQCPRWPVETQRCIATKPVEEQDPCFEALTPELQEAFVGQMQAAVEELRPASCVNAAAQLDKWTTLPMSATGLTQPDVDFIGGSLRVVLTNDCGATPWSESVMKCAATSATPAACLDAISATKRKEVEAKLAPRATLFVAAAERVDDAAVDCAHVAEAYYGAARWKGKAPKLKGAARTKAIAAARTKLETMCKDKAWTAFERSCVVLAKTDAERSWCLTSAQWAYPPGPDNPTTAGIAECDAYKAVLVTAKTCDKLPADTQAYLGQAADAASLPFIGVPAAEQAEACKYAGGEMKASLTQLGCTF